MDESKICFALKFRIMYVLIFMSVFGYVSSLDNFLQQESIMYGISVVNNTKTNVRCSLDLQIFAAALESREDWAIKMLDASGTARTQFTWGQNYWVGSQLQCETLVDGIKVQFSDKLYPKYPGNTPPPFDVQYYMAYFRHNSKLQISIHYPTEDVIHLGLCVPKTCEMEDVSGMLQKYFDTRTLYAQRLYNANFTMLQVKILPGDASLMSQPKFIVMAVVMLSTLICMIIGTLYDIYYWQPSLTNPPTEYHIQNNGTKIASKVNPTAKKDKNTTPSNTALGEVLLCFSICSNSKVMFNTEINSDSLPAIHGMRFLGMIWILMVHTMFYVVEVADNKLYTVTEGEEINNQIFSNATLAVDSFLFISGFLVSYLFYKDLKKNFKMTAFQHIQEYILTVLKRYFRLTPAYMVVLGLADITSTYVEQNSQYYMYERNNVNCGKYWWRNILYINNFYPRDEMCMSWSWYLSNDMQFFVLSVALLKISTICFAVSAGIVVILVVGCSALTAYIAYSYNYIPTLDEQFHMLDILYDPPWTRISPYLIGTVSGYILIKLKGKLILKKKTVTICWIIGAALNLTILFGLADKNMSVLASALYVGLSRLGWGIGIAWVILACATGNGGVVNSILGWRYLIPWSRLTYCVYLINPVIISSMFFMTSIPAHLEYMSHIIRFGSYTILIFFFAYIISLSFETPNILLTKLILNKVMYVNKDPKKTTHRKDKLPLQLQLPAELSQNGRNVV